jgi:hypothetical protein
MPTAFFLFSLLVFILSARQLKALPILASAGAEKITAKYLHFRTSIVRTGMAPNYTVNKFIMAGRYVKTVLEF